MKLLVLMSGPKIEQKGKKYPLYMTEVNKTAIVEKNVALYKNLNPSKIIYCVRKDDIKDYNIDKILNHLFADSICVSVYSQTKGAICTALLALEHINDDEEIVITSIDELIDVDYKEVVESFRKKNADAGVLSFESVHPRYSYARITADNKVEEVAEKKAISQNALASFYYFKKGSDFVKAAISVLKKDNPVQGAFFISQTINELILLQKNVELSHFDIENFFPLKTEEQLLEYVLSHVGAA